MKDSTFDTLTSAPSRRDVLRGLAAAGFGPGFARLPEFAGARKKRKKKKRKPKVRFNAFGCVSVGGFCQTAEQCCSGICEGEPGKKTCLAHDTGGCPPGIDEVGCGDPGTDVPCTLSTGETDGYLCNATTGNAGFCALTGDCFACRKDAECQEFYETSRAACVRCTACPETGGNACAYA